jgi:hypothetical protein
LVARKRKKEMKAENIKLPWSSIGLLIGKLVKVSRGGIDRAEAEDLAAILPKLLHSLHYKLNKETQIC